MSIISLGKVNSKFLIPIIGGIIVLVYKYVINLNPKYDILLNNPFILCLYTYLGMSLAFIPLVILKLKSKTQINNKENYLELNKVKKAKLLIKFEHYDIYERKKKYKYKLIIIATLFDFLQTLLTYIFCYNCIYNLWIFDIIFNSLFSYLILKTKIYKHQYFSMVIIIILGLGLNIIEFFKSEGNNKIKPLEILIKFLTEIFFCLGVVISKYNMETCFCNSYEICMMEGLINFILILITLLILNKIGITIENIKYPDNYYEYKNKFDKNDAFLIVLAVIAHFFYNISILITCDSFTPYHVLIILIIHECYYYLKADESIILNIFGFIILSIIFFMFLFFIEVLELNSFDISINTKKNIGIRADSEISINFIKDDILDDSYENETEEDKNKSLLDIPFTSNNNNNDNSHQNKVENKVISD